LIRAVSWSARRSRSSAARSFLARSGRELVRALRRFVDERIVGVGPPERECERVPAVGECRVGVDCLLEIGARVRERAEPQQALAFTVEALGADAIRLAGQDRAGGELLRERGGGVVDQLREARRGRIPRSDSLWSSLIATSRSSDGS
jgi:hypothetical protein